MDKKVISGPRNGAIRWSGFKERTPSVLNSGYSTGLGACGPTAFPKHGRALPGVMTARTRRHFPGYDVRMRPRTRFFWLPVRPHCHNVARSDGPRRRPIALPDTHLFRPDAPGSQIIAPRGVNPFLMIRQNQSFFSKPDGLAKTAPTSPVEPGKSGGAGGSVDAPHEVGGFPSLPGQVPFRVVRCIPAPRV